MHAEQDEIAILLYDGRCFANLENNFRSFYLNINGPFRVRLRIAVCLKTQESPNMTTKFGCEKNADGF
jgi:hypothetical protein